MDMGSVSEMAFMSTRSLNVTKRRNRDVSESETPVPATDKKTPVYHYKDRGYAWVVMFAVLLGFMCHGGISTTSTLTYQQLRPRFNMTATAAGWVTALHGTVRMFCSPLVSLLVSIFSYRAVTFTGGLLYSIGLILMAYAPTPLVVYIGYGVFSAVGSNMFILCSFVVLSQYFDKRLGKATGVALCGAGIGTIIFSPLIALMYDELGFTPTVMMEAGIVLQILIGASLYRPVSGNKSTCSKTVACPDEQSTRTHSPLKVMSRCCGLFISQLGFATLRHPAFLYMCVLCSSMMSQIFCAYIYTSGLAEETAGLTPAQVASFLSIGGFSEMPARLLSGIILDFKSIRPRRLYVFALFSTMSGLAFLSLQFSWNFVSMTVIWSLYQGFTLATHTQHVVMIGEVLPPDQLAGGIGILRVFQGVGLTIGPTFIGMVKDYLNFYSYGYLIIGGVHAILGMVFFPVAWWYYKYGVEKRTDLTVPEIRVQEDCTERK